MTNEFIQKILEVSVNINQALVNINQNLEPVPFWQDFSFWSAVILVFTLFWVWRYARATEQMAVYQIIPAIDVNMRYNPTSQQTYFWFLNTSNLPGKVYLKHKKNNEPKKQTYTPLRVPPQRSMRTADSDFGLSPSEGDKLTLYVVITPAIDKSKIKIKFEKSYSFKDKQWRELTWSFPDPPFPLPIATKKCPECKSDIPFDAKKCRYCLYLLKD